MRSRRDQKRDAPTVEVLDVDGVRTLAIVTVLWAVAFVALAFQRAALNDAGLGWWLWTCLAGVGLGLLGLEYCRKRRDAIADEELREEADADLQHNWPDAEQAEGVVVEEPLRADEHAADSQVEFYPAAAPLPERPVHAEPAEQFGYGADEEDQPMHHPEDQQQHREGRPPPGYVTTGDLPVVQPQQHPAPPPPPAPPARPPRAEPVPGPDPQHWNDQQWPPPAAPEPEWPGGAPQHAQPSGPYHSAAPAGYSPEPDRARRHPRDIEMARRRETEAGHAAGTPGPAAPPEFLQEDPEPAAPPQSPWEPGPPAAEPRAETDPVLESEFFSDIPTGGAPADPAEQSAPEDPDVLLGDTPPERARRDPSRDSSGEYRGRRARRD